MDFNYQLIAEIKEHKCLYDINELGYCNVREKERIWCLIAARLNSNVNACKCKWKSLRDTFNRYLKRCNSEKPPAWNRVWKYYRHMNFLRNACTLYSDNENPLAIDLRKQPSTSTERSRKCRALKTAANNLMQLPNLPDITIQLVTATTQTRKEDFTGLRVKSLTEINMQNRSSMICSKELKVATEEAVTVTFDGSQANNPIPTCADADNAFLSFNKEQDFSDDTQLDDVEFKINVGEYEIVDIRDKYNN